MVGSQRNHEDVNLWNNLMNRCLEFPLILITSLFSLLEDHAGCFPSTDFGHSFNSEDPNSDWSLSLSTLQLMTPSK